VEEKLNWLHFWFYLLHAISLTVCSTPIVTSDVAMVFQHIPVVLSFETAKKAFCLILLKPFVQPARTLFFLF